MAAESLRGVRVFFGHQSVGENIIEGLGRLPQGDRPPLTVARLEDGAAPAPGTLLHGRLGRNTDPESKFAAFEQLINGPLAGQIDIALMKLCYVDIDERTDVGHLFDEYRRVMDRLARRHPAVRFVHVTTPLRHCPGGAGVWLRERLGRPNRAKLSNIRRHAYNERLRHAFSPDRLFDLARYECTTRHGRRAEFRSGGHRYPHLVRAYTDDGGHLNELGQSWVATGLLAALSVTAGA